MELILTINQHILIIIKICKNTFIIYLVYNLLTNAKHDHTHDMKLISRKE
jgi:hypothetical protein